MEEMTPEMVTGWPAWIIPSLVVAAISLVLVAIGLTITLGVTIFKGGKWVGRVDSSIDGLTKAVEEIQKDIKQILWRLPSVPPAIVETGSPIRLTDFGKTVSADLKAAEWADRHAPKLVDEASDFEEFEVFDRCVEYVGEAFESDSDLRRTVRATAYEHGSDSEQVLKVYQVELRDRVLALIADG